MIDAGTARRWVEAGYGIALDEAEADRLAGLITATQTILSRQSAAVLAAAGPDALFLTPLDAHPRAMRAAFAEAAE